MRRRALAALARQVAVGLSGAQVMRNAGMVPDGWQHRLLTETGGDTAIVTSRQAGKSTAVAALALHRAYSLAGQLVMVVAPTLRQSIELTRKVRFFLPYLPGVVTVREAETIVELGNGSRVLAFPGKADAVRGPSPNLLIIDEAAFTPDDLYEAAVPARIRTQGDLVALSTPNGKSGWFYRMFTGTDDRTVRVEVPYTDVSAITPEFIDHQRWMMSTDNFEREYCCRFLAPANRVFNVEGLMMSDEDDRSPWMMVSVDDG